MMRKWVVGLVGSQILLGCAALEGIFPGLADGGTPQLLKAKPDVSITGRDYAVERSLQNLLAGDVDSRRWSLEADEPEGKESELINRIFPDYRSAIAHAESQGTYEFLPSADMVTAVTKQINDGLYARFELALEKGEGGMPAKPAWVRSVLDALLKRNPSQEPQSASRYDLQPWMEAAGRMWGARELEPRFTTQRTPIQPTPEVIAQAGLQTFKADPILSKPIGFFTWSQPLQDIFVRDRWLQGWFGDDKRAWLAQDGGIHPDADKHLAAGAIFNANLTAETRQDYERILTFYRKMTNPFSGYSALDLEALLPAGKTMADAATDPAVRQAMLTAAGSAKSPFLKFWAVLPPSTSPESELFYKLDAAGLLRPGQDRMQVLIDAIRAGQLSLAPQDDSGFYAYQQHALEALLKVAQLPEGQHIAYGEKYLKRLEEAFKTGLTKARETHAKQLDLMPAPTSAMPMPEGPAWAIEPLPTYYERLAASYGFLRTQVLPQFQADFRASARTLQEGGKDGTETIDQAVANAERFTQGLADLAKAEAGIAGVSDATAAAMAADWLKSVGQDRRLGVDTRVAVPVNQYLGDGAQVWVQYWGTAGVMLTKVRAKNQAGRGDKAYWLVTDKFIFFDRPYKAGPLNREEYRRILDGSGTLGEALRKLKG
jgi:hypothetical protein